MQGQVLAKPQDTSCPQILSTQNNFLLSRFYHISNWACKNKQAKSVWAIDTANPALRASLLGINTDHACDFRSLSSHAMMLQNLEPWLFISTSKRLNRRICKYSIWSEFLEASQPSHKKKNLSTVRYPPTCGQGLNDGVMLFRDHWLQLLLHPVEQRTQQDAGWRAADMVWVRCPWDSLLTLLEQWGVENLKLLYD